EAAVRAPGDAGELRRGSVGVLPRVLRGPDLRRAGVGRDAHAGVAGVVGLVGAERDRRERVVDALIVVAPGVGGASGEQGYEEERAHRRSDQQDPCRRQLPETISVETPVSGDPGSHPGRTAQKEETMIRIACASLLIAAAAHADVVKRYEECWGLFSAKKWDK